jgi:hypothetical protein
VGRFLEDPLDVPWPAVEFLADQLAIGDASCVKKYVQRSQTPYEHAWEIRNRYGYRSFEDQSCADAFARFLDGRAWTHAEGPVALFEHATGWLRRNRVLLPGVTVLARQVAAAREAAEGRLYDALAARPAASIPDYRSGCFARHGAAQDRGWCRRCNARGSSPYWAPAASRWGDIPANRLQVLARTDLGSKASTLARLGEPKRTATLVAVVRHLAAAVDDTLDHSRC